MWRYGLLGVALLSAACASEESAPTEGTAALSFGVSNGVRDSINLVDELRGDVYGALFLSYEVTLTGPIDGAQSYGHVALLGVDLTASDVSAQVWTSDPLPEDEYVFLGFFDVDGNAADTDTDPDAGDPVTLPVTNKFAIVPGDEVELTVTFDLVYN